MNEKLFPALAIATAIVISANSANAQPAGLTYSGQQAPARGQFIPGRYIVVLKPGATPESVSARYALRPEHTYTHALNGFAGAFPAEAVRRLLDDPQVEWIEEDQVVTIGAQTLPAGIDRVEADQNAKVAAAKSAGLGVDVDIAIIDTGIDLKHPDLYVFKNVTFVSGTKTGNDDNGHGTHCAGIAAARDNASGVVGVAPGARLWAVKVLDRNGSGTMSNVIKGVDYVTQYAGAIEVANMSLGGGNSETLKTAIAKSVAKGVVYAVAAGNSAVDAANTSPANSPEVLCVSAIVDTDGIPGKKGPATSYGTDDSFASFSNFGGVVDIAAPGVDVLSTYKGGAYARMSGTSMASPHVAGAVALYLVNRTKPTSSTQVAEVRTAVSTAAFPQSSTDGFSGDPDSSAEPLLNAKNL